MSTLPMSSNFLMAMSRVQKVPVRPMPALQWTTMGGPRWWPVQAGAMAVTSSACFSRTHWNGAWVSKYMRYGLRDSLPAKTGACWAHCQVSRSQAKRWIENDTRIWKQSIIRHLSQVWILTSPPPCRCGSAWGPSPRSPRSSRCSLWSHWTRRTADWSLQAPDYLSSV